MDYIALKLATKADIVDDPERCKRCECKPDCNEPGCWRKLRLVGRPPTLTGIHGNQRESSEIAGLKAEVSRLQKVIDMTYRLHTSSSIYARTIIRALLKGNISKDGGGA